MFTSNQIEEIRKKLQPKGKECPSFSLAGPLKGNDTQLLSSKGRTSSKVSRLLQRRYESTPTLTLPGVYGNVEVTVLNNGTGYTKIALAGSTYSPNRRYHVVLPPFSDSNAEVSASLVKGSVSTSGFTVITHKNGSLANISFDFTIIAQ